MPEAILKQIPSSTIGNRENRDINKLFGLEHVHNFQDNLKMIKDFLSVKSSLKAAKAVYFIYSAYVTLFDAVKNKKKVFRQSKKIVKTSFFKM